MKTGSDSDHLAGTTRFFPISPFFSIPQADGLFYNGGISESFDYSGELRLASPADKRLRWSAGVFYYHQDDETAIVGFGQAAPDFEGLFDDKRTITNQAVFATVDFDISDSLELSLEARYQEEEKGLVDFGNGPDFAPTYEDAEKFKDFIPKAILSYDINDRASAYASFAKGVKPGGVNGPIGVPTNNEFYDPEESNAFEIGFKSTTSDGKGTITLAGFFNDISKYQLTTPVAGLGTAINSVATNQGDAEILGFEFEGNYNLTDDLNIGASYAWTDAEFTSGCDDFQFTLNTGGYLIQPFDLDDPSTQGFIRNPADPNTVGSGLSTPTADPNGLFTGNTSCSIAGNTIPMTSEHQFSVFGSFERPISETTDFFANVDYTYESSKYIQVHNLAETGDTGILGANVGVRRGNARLEIFGRNLLNERTPPIATRWFDSLEGFNTIGASVVGRESIDRSPVGPRSYFLSFRRGSQVGVRASLDF